MKLENWAIVTSNPNPYQPPECQKKQLHGEVYGSDRFGDGEKVTTSDVEDIKNGIAKTANADYELGQIDKKYLAAYPSAKKYIET